MRILIVSPFFPPQNSIASLRPYSWAKYWTLAGHDVTVLTVDQPQDPSVSLQFTNPGYRVIALPLPSFLEKLKQGYGQQEAAPKKTKSTFSLFGLAKKLFDWLRHRKGIFNACRFPDFTHLWIKPALAAVKDAQPWDLVVSTAGPYTSHIVASAIKRRKQAALWIADYRDGWTLNPLYKGLFPLSWMEKTWERRVLREADTISVVSEPMAKQMRDHFGHPHVITIPNGFDPEDLSDLSPEPIFPADGKFRLVHTGTMYAGKRDPTPLFRAIAQIAQEPSLAAYLERLEVLFVGPRQANVEEMIRHYGVEKWVKMTGFVSREKALRMQRDAHALLFLPWNDPEVDGILTGKIFEYLYAGTPILAIGGSHVEESQRLILEAKAGRILENAAAIYEYFANALSDPKRSPNQAEAAVLKRYERKQLALDLLQQAFSDRTPSIAIVIVTYNSQKHLPKLLACLKQQTRQPEQVVFVDTGSTDLSYHEAYRQMPGYQLVVAEKESGFCHGNNLGMQVVDPGHSYVLFLNPDAFLTPTFLEEALTFMEKHTHCGALTGTVLGYNIEVDQPTGFYDSTGIFQTWYGRWFDRAQGVAVKATQYQDIESIPAICGALFFVRRKALQEVLLSKGEVFDPAFYMYKEDIDLSLRLRKKGWQLFFVPSLIAYHCRGWNPDRRCMPRKFRLASVKNEWTIHRRERQPLAAAYSLTKYAAVKFFDL